MIVASNESVWIRGSTDAVVMAEQEGRGVKLVKSPQLENWLSYDGEDASSITFNISFHPFLIYFELVNGKGYLSIPKLDSGEFDVEPYNY